MDNKITTSLIISTYNWPEALELSLKSVENQTILPNEVIIADDGSTNDTKKIVDLFKKRKKLNIIHVWHEDKGFRLAEIRNKAIKVSSSDYIIQIDGDIIISKQFIEDHINFAQKNTFVRGIRTKIGPKLSKEILHSKRINISFFDKGLKTRENSIRSKMLSKIVAKKSTDPYNVLGCNMAFWRKDLIAVNGYSNDLKGWGHEDTELCARLINNNIYKIKLKYRAIAYHIHHEERSKEQEQDHIDMINHIMQEKIIRCTNGLEEIE